MSPGLPGFTLQTADDESRFTGIGIPLLCFPLKTVQTWVIFLWWIPGWKCKHGASICWKPCQNQRKFTEFTRIWNEGTFFLKEYGRIEAKLVYFFSGRRRQVFWRLKGLTIGIESPYAAFISCITISKQLRFLTPIFTHD